MRSRTAPIDMGNMILIGVALMLLGDLLFALNDVMGKWLVASFAVGQVLIIRSIGSFIVLGPMLVRQGGAAFFKVEQPGLQFTRAAMTTGDVALFYTAVRYLPLADVMTFYMAGPIYVAAISHFVLGERIGWRRWLAVGIGFAGVVIALRPSTAMFSLPSVFAVGGSLAFAFTLVLNRYLRATSDTTLVTWQTVAALIVGLAMSMGEWQTPLPSDWFHLLLLGVIATTAHLLLTRSLKMAPASLLAPLQYSLLLWAIVFGYLFFGDIPDAQLLFGAMIIVLAGLFIFHRKNLKANLPAEAVASDGH